MTGGTGADGLTVVYRMPDATHLTDDDGECEYVRSGFAARRYAAGQSSQQPVRSFELTPIPGTTTSPRLRA